MAGNPFGSYVSDFRDASTWSESGRRIIAFTPHVVVAVLFVTFFWTSLVTLLGDWWSGLTPDQGLLLAPLAFFLAWKMGLAADHRAQPKLATAMLAACVFLRFVAEIAVDRYTLRVSMILAAAALVVFYFGFKQLARWWLPAVLLLLAVPLPTGVWNVVAYPLQVVSARIGAVLLATRHLPVELVGTVIRIPGQTLLVTEGCSGLGSLMTICTLSLVVGHLTLRTSWARVALLVGMAPIALLLNGIRIFITGFLIFFVGREYGTGTPHIVLGWIIFALNFGLLVGYSRVLEPVEAWLSRRQANR